ncbi:HlyD family efflux transporter periplasmic adaptor subunit [Achromobacter seleniivolatilans]|uniref:HlyD family efflux transporter periplasmic adaptor subunit n=1 Tax=Achromobacter seleniivolatilans TaxID=3047478 RepID=A0ABY9LW38_9BURK|nr:HlyD family efflux transporter periplasmic adaptor subunit [Achromobacter sp. R39]WMD18982.1 HlyD family efflux transporter periplasmic adaptor subunit [Achromobacter sp. R39]
MTEAVSRDKLLATLLQLEKRARACANTQELAFLMVNDTHALAPYRQAALWMPGTGGDGEIAALSGLAVPDKNAPYTVWLASVLADRARDGASGVLLPQPDEQAMWAEHLPAHGLLLRLPLTAQDSKKPGDALLALWRDTPWPGSESTMLGLLADAYAHAWRALTPVARRRRASAWWGRLRHGERRTRWWLGLGAAVAVLMCVPVRQSVLAPAEVVARAPMAVRAPLQGVVDRIAVTPNQAVEKGQLLAALDVRDLEGRLESARQALAVAETELRQNQQQALVDDRSKATLALAQGKREQAASDMDFYAKAVARAQLRAERAGIALFDDPADWIGKPVALGERIMMVADPADVELEIHLPVGDAIELPAQAPVQLFLNTAPVAPLSATLLRVGYRAAPTADGAMAYRVRARFDEAGAQEVQPRVGLKGTAKLYGERTPLVGYLLRKPLATLRVWLGM